MPSNTFTRPGDVDKALVSITPFATPSGFVMRSHSGVVNTRSAMEVGRTWTEEYGLLNTKRPDTHEFLSWVSWAWSRKETISILHDATPGSGEPPLGSPSGTPVVSGASQTGSTIATSGWSSGQSGLLLPGDHIKFAGLNLLYRVLSQVNSDGTGNATIEIDPPIFQGNSPANGASVSTSDNYVNAKIIEAPTLPNTASSFWWAGLTLKFVEVP